MSLFSTYPRDLLAVSSVTVAATLPWLLFGLLAGVIVDRTDRWRAMVTIDVLRGASLAVFAVIVLRGSPTLLAIVLMVFALGVGETIFDTAAQAALPAVVPEDRLERANGRLFGAQIAMNGFIGPPLGALLFATSAAGPFAFDAATFLVSALLLRRLVSGCAHHSPAKAYASILTDVREGLSWLWGHPGVRAFAIGAAIVNLAHTAAMAILVLLVRDELGGSALSFGLVLTGAAVGSIAGTQIAGWLVQRAGRRQAVILATATFSTSLLLVGTAPNVLAAAAGLATFGAAGEVWNVIAVSYRQARVPDRLLGRVMATYRVLAYGAMPVGALLGGALAKVSGVRATVISGAIAAGLLCLYFSTPSRAGLFET